MLVSILKTFLHTGGKVFETGGCSQARGVRLRFNRTKRNSAERKRAPVLTGVLRCSSVRKN